MNEHTFELTEVTGTSSSSIEDAIQSAVSRVGKTNREMRWFQVTEIRGAIHEGKASQWQVTVKIGSRME
ncbi:MAG: dodecin family protein [Planctomycetota bacterium]|nr:dodecin family protein [Planctomycetota bacterium]